jgi:hypothetical protein
MARGRAFPVEWWASDSDLVEGRLADLARELARGRPVIVGTVKTFLPRCSHTTRWWSPCTAAGAWW